MKIAKCPEYFSIWRLKCSENHATFHEANFGSCFLLCFAVTCSFMGLMMQRSNKWFKASGQNFMYICWVVSPKMGGESYSSWESPKSWTCWLFISLTSVSSVPRVPITIMNAIFERLGNYGQKCFVTSWRSVQGRPKVQKRFILLIESQLIEGANFFLA